MRCRAVVFDLGAVMVEWNPAAIVASFTDDLALQKALLVQLYEHDDWLALDRGILSEAQLIANLSDRCALPRAQAERLIVHTKHSLLAIDNSVEALRSAKAAGLGAYCLSNICEPFFDFLANRYGFFSEFDGAIVSAREKTIKPEVEIFQRLLDRYELLAGDCLFVDDRLDNIQTAQRLGFHTVHFSASPSCYNAIHQFIQQSRRA